MVLSRLLFPDAFGLASIVATLITALDVLSDTGIIWAIIQSKRGDEKVFLNTVWTTNVIRGFLLWGVCGAIAWPLAHYYKQPQLLYLIPVAGIGNLLIGLTSTSVWTLMRHLRMGTGAMLGLTQVVVTTVAMIVWARLTHSVWALVGGGLIGRAVYVALSHVVIKGYRNRFHWDRGVARELFHFGKWIFVSTAVTFFAMQSDKLMLAKMAPVAVLGVYSIATNMVKIPSDILAQLCHMIIFPMLSRGEDAASRMRASLLHARHLILPAGVAATLAFTVGAPAFFNLFYDARYQQAGFMGQLAAVGIWIYILQMSADRALLARGDTRALAFSNIANLIVTVIGAVGGFYLGQRLSPTAGVAGFILGCSAGNLAGHLVVQHAMARQGIPILLQDLSYTALLGLLAAVSLFVPFAAAHFVSVHTAQLIGVAVGAFAVGGASLWAGLRLKAAMRERKAA